MGGHVMGFIKGAIFDLAGKPLVNNALVELEAEEGVGIAVADIDDEDGETVRSQIQETGGRALYVHCDVSDPGQVKRAIDRTANEFGRLDIVFANAGINGVWAPLDELQPEEWDKTLAVNLKGTFLTVRYAVPHLKRNGTAGG